jgi:stress-induced morphogen
MIPAQELRSLLHMAFPDAEIHVEDVTGQQDHYATSIVTNAFEGKSRLEQHQLVYRTLGSVLLGPLHALSLRTFTPATWRDRDQGTP